VTGGQGTAAYLRAGNNRNNDSLTGQDVTQNPPAFNVPGVIVALGTLLIVVHTAMIWVSDEQYREAILLFSFIPITYDLPLAELYEPAARYWSPLTYAFLHGDWAHLLVNGVWLLAFGSAVARRFGNTKFALFMVAGAVAGAGFHYIFHPMGNVPVIGASASVSACMGAAIRFAFKPGGVTSDIVNTPALSLVGSLKNRSIMIFVVIWFAINWVAGTGMLTPGDAGIAWEAHMGGFLLGWLGFSLFDRRRLKPAL